MWSLMVVLGIGVNLVVANVAIAACGTSASCQLCVMERCEQSGW